MALGGLLVILGRTDAGACSRGGGWANNDNNAETTNKRAHLNMST